MVKKAGKYHFIGIGGIGMSGLARLLLEMKHSVSGSDQSDNTLCNHLRELGAEVYVGAYPDSIDPDDFVVYSSGIAVDHPERKRAEEKRCQIFHRSDLLAALTEGRQSLFVAGTHGKTTTSSLLAHVLVEAGEDPSFALGGIVLPYAINARKGEGALFVAEADESDGTLTKYSPSGAIVTNITDDHLGHYGSMERLHQAFQQFMSQVQSSEHLFWCADDPSLAAMCPMGRSYGFSSASHFTILHFQQKGGWISFSLQAHDISWEEIQVPLMGKHNARNASAVFLLCNFLGIPEEKIRKAFSTFRGVKRRSEMLCQDQITVIDDYAHHPHEIEATTQSIRQAYPHQRIIAIFQPHRYSRVKQYLRSFPKSFAHVDEVLITEIDGANEAGPSESLESVLMEEFSRRCPVSSLFVPQPQVVNHLLNASRKGDVLLFLGAGSITKTAHAFAEAASTSSIPRWRVALFCGGQSIEHSISLVTARFVRQALISAQHEVEIIGITPQGRWCCGNEWIQAPGTPREGAADPIPEAMIKKFLAADISIPCFHGPLGEDGSVQGLFEFMNRPFVGCGTQAAAIAMNKLLCKRIAEREGIDVVPYVGIAYHQWLTDPSQWAARIERDLQFPLFIKPVHLGSSLGIVHVKKREDLIEGMEEAFQFDPLILVEQAVPSPRELEYALLGDFDQAEVYGPGEVLTQGQFYHFGVKYGEHAMKGTSNPSLPPHIVEKGRDWAKRVYAAIGGEGFARVDFLLDPQEQLWFSEINPFPGLTPTSLYPEMVQAGGIHPAQLIERLIYLGWKRWRQKNQRIQFQHRDSRHVL